MAETYNVTQHHVTRRLIQHLFPDKLTKSVARIFEREYVIELANCILDGCTSNDDQIQDHNVCARLLAEYRKLEKDTKTKHRLCDQENRLSVLEKENVFLKATVHEVNHELESLRQVLRAQSPRAAEVLKKGSIKRPKPQHAASRANKKIRK